MRVATRVLSAGAVEPGLVKVIDAFWHETGHDVKVIFATAPVIRKRLGGEAVDVVIAPPATLDELVKLRKAAAAERVTVGRIGVGVAVWGGAPLPKIGTVDEFKHSLLSAASVVYNQASTGIYLEGLFDRLGIGEELKAKTTRYPDFAAVLAHMSKGRSNEIGLGATTVILEAGSKGLQFVGPLPAEIQNYTTYAAAVLAEGGATDPARALARFITTPTARAALTGAGIE